MTGDDTNNTLNINIIFYRYIYSYMKKMKEEKTVRASVFGPVATNWIPNGSQTYYPNIFHHIITWAEYHINIYMKGVSECQPYHIRHAVCVERNQEPAAAAATTTPTTFPYIQHLLFFFSVLSYSPQCRLDIFLLPPSAPAADAVPWKCAYDVAIINHFLFSLWIEVSAFFFCFVSRFWFFRNKTKEPRN